VADEANAEKCAKGMFCTFIVDLRAEENPVPISTLPAPKERDFCGFGTFGPHNLHENRPGHVSPAKRRFFATYNVAGVRVFDIKDAFAPKEIAYWVPPAPKKLIDPRPNVAPHSREERKRHHHHLRHPVKIGVDNFTIVSTYAKGSTKTVVN